MPFVLAVLVSAWIGGLGPGLLASVLTPVAATIWFTAWPHDAPPLQWAAHVLFFLLISALSALLMSELQRSSREQSRRCGPPPRMRPGGPECGATAAHRRRGAGADFLHRGDGIYRFANKLYETWFGTSADKLSAVM